MRDSMSSPSVLIISDDSELVEALINNNKTGQKFIARESVQYILDEPTLLDDNSIVIFDIGANNNDVNAAIDQALKIKQQDPTQILMLTGESDSLSEILKSSIQPLVYRAFTKPVNPNQMFLAFKSGNALHMNLLAKRAEGIDISVVGPVENKTNVASLAGERKNSSMAYAAIGMAALLIVGWLLLSDSNEAPIPQVKIDSKIPSPKPIEKTVTTESDSQQRIKQLNQLATNAMQEERVMAPKGDNALEYYDQVLAIDAYDTTAYKGKKAIADRLRVSYNLLVTNAEFDRALKVLNVLRRIEPLNLQNDALRGGLEKAIDVHVKKVKESGTSQEIAQTAIVLEKIGAEFASSKSASDALKAEKALVTKIDAALAANLLFPPEKGNAYNIVSEALRANTVSKGYLTPRVKGLSAKLLALANESVTQDRLDEADKLAALVKRLNVDNEGLEFLNTKIQQSKAAKAAAIAAQEAAEAATELEPVKNIPAKVISRTPPRYPNRARNRNIEGWVEVSFNIDVKGEPLDIKVVNAEPKGIFDSAAIKAVMKWRFSPERDEATGLPVLSEKILNKVNFKLE